MENTWKFATTSALSPEPGNHHFAINLRFMHTNTGADRYSVERVKDLLAEAYADLPEPDPARLVAMETRLLAGLPRRRKTRTWQWGGLLLLGAAGLAAAWWSAPLWWPASEGDKAPTVSTSEPAPTTNTKAVPAMEQTISTPAPQPGNIQNGERKRSSTTYRKEEY